MTGEVFIEVFRFEHVDCKITPGHGPYYYPLDDGGVDCRRGTTFGGVGCGPRDIAKYESCGVTRDQFAYWLADDLTGDCTFYKDAGWSFVRYLVPVEELHEDRGQVVFVARPEYFAGRVNWRDVPARKPRSDRWSWHNQYVNVVRPGRELVNA